MCSVPWMNCVWASFIVETAYPEEAVAVAHDLVEEQHGVNGAMGPLWASRLLSAFFFGAQATDPATFSAAIGLFFCAVFVAAPLPALRSFRVDPAVALRHE